MYVVSCCHLTDVWNFDCDSGEPRLAGQQTTAGHLGTGVCHQVYFPHCSGNEIINLEIFYTPNSHTHKCIHAPATVIPADVNSHTRRCKQSYPQVQTVKPTDVNSLTHRCKQSYPQMYNHLQTVIPTDVNSHTRRCNRLLTVIPTDV